MRVRRVSDGHEVLLGDRTWRQPVSFRVALICAHALVVTVAAWLVWLTLSGNQLHGEVAPIVAAPLWAWLAFRVWTASATLTRDAIVIRNVLYTEEVAVADITEVAFGSRRTVLKVTERRLTPATSRSVFRRRRDPGERHTVTAIQVGLLAALHGARCAADDAAGLIAAAAGLPAPRPRKPRLGQGMYLVAFPFGIAMLVLIVALYAPHLTWFGLP
jgi:hypothetical protein